MSFIFRLVIAIGFAILAFAGPLAWARAFRLELISYIEFQELDDAIAAGRTEEAAQLEREILQGFGAELSPIGAYKLFAAEMLTQYWGAWGLLVVGVSYGVFLILGRRQPSNQAIQQPNVPVP